MNETEHRMAPSADCDLVQGSPRVVVGVDGSDGAIEALDRAVEESRLRRAKLEVVVSWRYWPSEGVTMVTPSFDEDARKIAAASLDAVRASAPELEVIQRISPEPAPRELVRCARGADLLVVGSRGLGAFRGLLVGSVSQHCARHASCPVLITRKADETTAQKPSHTIVVGFDGSQGAQRALEWAAAEARLSACSLIVASSWSKNGDFVTADEIERCAEEDAGRAAASLRDRWPAIDISVSVVEGRASAVLCDAARDARMLVVGSRGLGGFKGMLLGSVGLHCLHHALCPVVVVPNRDPMTLVPNRDHDSRPEPGP
jgi:nucleotide-binding universal stress UspA family protein